MTLDTFEQSLLTTLRGHVAARTPAPRRTRRRIAVPATLGAALAAVAVALGLTLTQSPAAYAVEKASNGDIVVTIHRLDDAAGLEQALRAQGINADVDYDASLPKPDAGGTTTRTDRDSGPSIDKSGTVPAGGPCNPPSVRTGATKGDFTMRIPAGDYSGDVLHLTTGGSLSDGIIALRADWTMAGC